MKRDKTPRKRDRLKALLKWKGQDKTSQAPPQALTAGTSSAIGSPRVLERSGNSQRTTARYLKAAKALEEVVNGCKIQWGSFDFPKIRGEPIKSDFQFTHEVDMDLEAHKSILKDQRAWEKCQHIVLCLFSALSPFAENFLAIAAQAQSVPPCVSP